MSAVNAPQGMVPIYHPSGLSRPVAIEGAIDATVTQTFKKGTPVALTTAGLIVPISDVAWDAAADDLFGVFNGVEYTDSVGRHEANQWVGPITGTSNIIAYVWMDPDIIYEVQADGAVAQTAIGDQFNFAAVESGSAITGISNMRVAATPVGAGNQGLVRCLNKSLRPDNDWGDAFTWITVQFAAHQFVANKVAI